MSSNRTQWRQIALFLEDKAPRRKVTPPPVSKRRKAYSKAVGLLAASLKRMEITISNRKETA